MPFLREAVEKQRRFFMNQLIENGLLKHSDKPANKFTLTELKHAYNNFCKKGVQK
ncbi:Fur-regulated basic protein FbpA [Bacillus sp. T33-2]|nr:Fur-regulated basic protein FbpA [Bacillus sp. T33-2]